MNAGWSASDRAREAEFADTAAGLRQRLRDTLNAARQAVSITQRLVAEAQASRARRARFRSAVLNDRTQAGVGRALRESERAIALRDQFVALVAHEMRQPLQAAAAATVLLESDAPPSTRARATSVLRRQLERLSRLVEDLLESARLAVQGVELQLQQLDLMALMQRVVRDVKHHVDQRSQDLVVSFPSEDVIFVADAFRVHQVCINLLENAVRYTPHGGRIWFEAGRVGPEVELIVRDDGPGIPSEVQPHLFDMFTRASRIGSGVGVGLAVVRQLVALHEGRIELTSTPGQGAQFVVRLPVAGPTRKGVEDGLNDPAARHGSAPEFFGR
jgi:signal transduction histidine kinase